MISLNVCDYYKQRYSQHFSILLWLNVLKDPKHVFHYQPNNLQSGVIGKNKQTNKNNIKPYLISIQYRLHAKVYDKNQS